MTTTQLRIYTMKPGRLDAWVGLFTERVRALRAANGFTIDAWSAPDEEQFVWIVTHEGTREDFEAADKAYYELPEHKELHEIALTCLERGESRFIEPIGEARA